MGNEYFLVACWRIYLHRYRTSLVLASMGVRMCLGWWSLSNQPIHVVNALEHEQRFRSNLVHLHDFRCGFGISLFPCPKADLEPYVSGRHLLGRRGDNYPRAGLLYAQLRNHERHSSLLNQECIARRGTAYMGGVMSPEAMVGLVAGLVMVSVITAILTRVWHHELIFTMAGVVATLAFGLLSGVLYAAGRRDLSICFLLVFLFSPILFITLRKAIRNEKEAREHGARADALIASFKQEV
jgi:uncharacterized membrane protein